MDAGAPQPERAALHGLVRTAMGARSARLPLRGAGWLLAAAVVVAALSAIAGGLLRAGVVLPGTWWTAALVDHAALMVGCFMGTVIAVERAVALRRPFAWVAPVLSAAAGVALLAGARTAGAVLLLAAGIVFVAVNVAWGRRPAAPHTALLLAGAVAWLAGHALFAAGASPAAVVPWWFAFLVVTIAAERLEMTRLMRRRRGAAESLYIALAAQFGGAALVAAAPVAAGVLYGASLVLLAAWLFAFDIARRTVFAAGLPRYMAACLLGGYAWLAIGGLAWAATALGAPCRDAALHAIGIGFVLSMMFGHAPVILPAVAGVKLRFGHAFYLPLALLHVSLLLRLGPGSFDAAWRAGSSAGNALAIGLFALTAAAGAWAHAGPTRSKAHQPR